VSELARLTDHWFSTKDGDAKARELFHRHYSYRPYKDGRKPKLFVGPGQKEVLVTENYDALFVWRKFISSDGQEGVNCSIFRNESPVQASRLILEAEQVAVERWGYIRAYTYVKPSALSGTCPGYCFIRAKWRRCGVTKVNKLLIFEKQLRPDLL